MATAGLQADLGRRAGHGSGWGFPQAAHVRVRAHSPTALLPVVYERLITLDAADHHARIVNCECLAVRRYHTMNVADDLAIFLEIKVPRVRIDLLGVGRVQATTHALFHVLALAVLHAARHLLAVRA